MAYVEIYPPYKVVLNVKTSFATAYKKITDFNKTYQEDLIKIYAFSEPIRVTQFEFNDIVYSKELNSYKKGYKSSEDGDIQYTSIDEDEYITAIEAYRKSELDKLNAERDSMLDILYVSDEKYKYQVPTLYNEIMNQMNTYAPKHKREYVANQEGVYTSCKDIFYFDDTIVPMNIFAYLRKEYPYFMNYIDTFELQNEDDIILVDFKKVNV
jgi:hypothetical protein